MHCFYCCPCLKSVYNCLEGDSFACSSQVFDLPTVSVPSLNHILQSQNIWPARPLSHSWKHNSTCTVIRPLVVAARRLLQTFRPWQEVTHDLVAPGRCPLQPRPCMLTNTIQHSGRWLHHTHAHTHTLSVVTVNINSRSWCTCSCSEIITVDMVYFTCTVTSSSKD